MTDTQKIIEVCHLINKTSSKLTQMLGVEVEIKIVSPLLENFIKTVPAVPIESDSDEILISKVVGFTCLEYGITVDELRAKKRKRHLVDARKMVAGLLYDYCPGLTQTEVGGMIRVDRSSISFYIDQSENLRHSSKAFKAKHNQIKDKLDRWLITKTN